MTNATFDEVLSRVGMDRLFTSRALVCGRSLFVSALFGLSHMNGIPNGLFGMIFAGLFGLAMCLVRETSKGAMIWMIVAHFAADVILIGGAYGFFTW